jgi:hypothetical protein
MSVTKTLALTNRQQLFDLNGETTNFDLTFTATSQDGSPFHVLVVDQTTLDNTPDLEYKLANGTISGNIVSDKNVYQNYFLCMKADKPCSVNVEINKKEIAPKPKTPPPPMRSMTPSAIPPVKPNNTNWKMIIIAIVIIGGGALLYYMYNKKKSEGNDNVDVELVPDVPLKSPVSEQIVSPKVTTNFGFGGRKANESLIARLNSMHMK